MNVSFPSDWHVQPLSKTERGKYAHLHNECLFSKGLKLLLLQIADSVSQAVHAVFCVMITFEVQECEMDFNECR
jgi:hypothetical protein